MLGGARGDDEVGIGDDKVKGRRCSPELTTATGGSGVAAILNRGGLAAWFGGAREGKSRGDSGGFNGVVGARFWGVGEWGGCGAWRRRRARHGSGAAVDEDGPDRWALPVSERGDADARVPGVSVRGCAGLG